MPDTKEVDRALIKGSELVRELTDGWSEFVAKNDRKFYKNSITQELSWKPPRKTNFNEKKNNAVTQILPEDNVGEIIRKGTMLVTKFGEKTKFGKKKKFKCVVFLTNSHFLYRKKTKLDDFAGKFSLSTAIVGVDDAKKGKYYLISPRASIVFQCKEILDSEEWYHELERIIENITVPSDRSFYRSIKTDQAELNDEEKNKKNRLPNDSGINLPLKGILKQPKIYDSAIEKIEEVEEPNIETKDEIKLSIFDTGNSDADKDITKNPVICHRRSLPISGNIAPREIKRLSSYTPTFSQQNEIRYPTPPGWVSKFDSKTGRYVYENEITQEVWASGSNSNGILYFYDTENNRTSLLLPCYNVPVESKTQNQKITEV